MLVAGLAAALLAGGAAAGTTTWSPNKKGSWMDKDLWSNGVPKSPDLGVILTGISRIKLQAGDDPAVCGVLTVGGGDEGACHLVSGSLAITSSLRLGNAGTDTGAFKLLDGTLTSIYSRVGGAGTGSFVHEGGGHGTAAKPVAEITVGETPGSKGTYTMSGGELHATKLVVGHQNKNGTASFSMTGGASTVTSLRVGAAKDSVGTVTIEKGSLKSSALCAIGAAGEGTLELAGTGTLETSTAVGSSLVIGESPTGKGTLTLTKGVLKASAPNGDSPALVVGANGSGTMEVVGGTDHKVTGHVRLATQPGGAGTLRLNGGLLDVTENLILSCPPAGAKPAGKARVVLDGAGDPLRLRVRKTLSLAESGDGEIEFRNKARVEVGNNVFPKGKIKGKADFARYEAPQPLLGVPFLAGGPELVLEPDGDASPHGDLLFEGDGVLDGGVIVIDIDGFEPGATLDQVVFTDTLSTFGTTIAVAFGPSIDLASLPEGTTFPIVGAAAFEGWLECPLPPTGNPATALALMDVAVPTDDGLELWKAVVVTGRE